jgi:hypothetical protein
MTGPTAAFEGRHGLCEQVTGPFELGALGGGGPFAIERTNFKFFAAEYHAQAPLAVALALRDRVRVEEIETLDVQIYAMAHSEIGSEPAKWDPQTRETADHSLPYMLAVALVDGRITPASFEPKRYLDPSLRPIMNRIRVAENPELTRRFPGELPSQIDVTTRSGLRFTERAEYPKGHARNPMTDGDVERFRVSRRASSASSGGPALETLWRLDEVSRMGAVVDLFILTLKRCAMDLGLRQACARDRRQSRHRQGHRARARPRRRRRRDRGAHEDRLEAAARELETQRGACRPAGGRRDGRNGSIARWLGPRSAQRSHILVNSGSAPGVGDATGPSSPSWTKTCRIST